MPFVAAPNIIKMEILATKALQKIENVIHVDVFHPPTVTDCNALINAVGLSIASTWVSHLPNDLTINAIRCTSLQTQNDIQVETAFGVPLAGTVIGEPLPNANTLCISARSTSIGRSARGRLYWLGLAITQVASNVVDAVEGEQILAAVEDVRNTIAGLGYSWAIVSYVANGAPRPGGPVYFLVESVRLVDLVVDSQRRRKPGVGQ